MFSRRVFNEFLRIGINRRPEKSCKVLSHTLIMERCWQIPAPKLNRMPQLKRRHDIYKVKRIERGVPNLTVILTKDSMDFGVEGEKIDLPKPIARKLLINKEAIYASPDNINEMEMIQEKVMQTQSGRRTVFWIQSQTVLSCPFQITKHKDWILTPENLARCLKREHQLNVAPSCITLPDYPITSDTTSDTEHVIQISVNKSPPVPLTIKITDWTPENI